MQDDGYDSELDTIEHGESWMREDFMGEFYWDEENVWASEEEPPYQEEPSFCFEVQEALDVIVSEYLQKERGE